MSEMSQAERAALLNAAAEKYMYPLGREYAAKIKLKEGPQGEIYRVHPGDIGYDDE